MKVAIIGHGKVGGALARSWASKGHEIFIGARDPESGKVAALEALDNISGMTIEEASSRAETLLLAPPANAVPGLIPKLGELDSKVLIDATNTIGPGPEGYATAFHAFKDLTKAELVKCFNTTGFENMVDPVYGEIALDMFMAGDSTRAKEVARQLALDAGFATCYDFGGDDKAQLLEHLALCWINLAIFQGEGRNIGIKILRR